MKRHFISMESEVRDCLIGEEQFVFGDSKDEYQEVEEGFIEVFDEVEQATDFLFKAGLADLSKIYQQGNEISDAVVNDSVRQRHLTEKQAQTVRSRIKTLNKTLRSRQPRRKQRQDIREFTWNAETSSTGTRSRSATPDSLDSNEVLNEDLTSDEDQQISLTPFPMDSANAVFKGKLKWTSSEPIQNKVFSRPDRCDVAHLGSENVVLKGYQPLNEYGTLPRTQRERSGSDPTTEVHLKSLENHTSELFLHTRNNFHNQLSRSHNNLLMSRNDENIEIENENGAISFEGLRQIEDIQPHIEGLDIKNNGGVKVDNVADSLYQYLKPLLYVEVTAIFDQHKIVVLKRKANFKHKGGNVFGVPLSTLVMRDMPRPSDNSMVPEIFKTIINQLNTRCIHEDGILRIAGQKQKLEMLCNEIETKFYNNRRYVEGVLQQATVHDLTGILKRLLRDLPDPIFTMELLDMFYKCNNIPTLEDRVRALNLLVLLLPIEHRNTFRLLLQFLLNIIENEKQNRMNLRNVATITMPSFFPSHILFPQDHSNKPKPATKADVSKQLNGTADCCRIMETMLYRGDSLWIVPGELAQQAKEAQQRAKDRKDFGKEKDKRTRIIKKKLVRSSTQYEPGSMAVPRMKRDFYI